MLAPHLKAGAGTLAHAATMTAEAYDDFQAMARQLSGRLDDYLAGWQGAGATAFQQLHMAWQQHHAKIAALLTELESAFHTTDRAFGDADAAAQHGMNNVASELGTRLG